ncbi:MAG: RNA polymerase sigma factor [Panacagrimonas sp.]
MIAAEDLSLLKAAQQGDRYAMERLLVTYQPNIRRYAQRHCLISDIDDAVQESLLILSRKLSTVKALAAFSGWLLKVVQRECRRLGRATFNWDPFEESRLDEWLARHSTDELRVELINTLESLPKDYREIILLRDFEERTIGEIARRIGLTSAATKSRLHRARVLCREYLLGDVPSTPSST